MAEYLRSLMPAELPLAVTYLTGRPFPERDPRSTGIGWSAIAAAAEQIVDASSGALGAAYNESSDLGQAVGDLFEANGHAPEGSPPTLVEADGAFTRDGGGTRQGQTGATPRAARAQRSDNRQIDRQSVER